VNVSTMLNSDFAAGALSVLGLLAIKKIYDLYQYPAEAKTQKLAKAPISKIGDDSVITIWGFEPSLSERGREAHYDSPYVDRVEAYLCLKKMAYKKAITNALQENPRKKVPFANVYGTMVDDSTRILAVLQEKLNDTTKAALTDKQRAEGTMVRAILFGRLYFVMNHAHFGTEPGREEFRQHIKKDIPSPILPLIHALIVRGQQRNLYGAGIAQLPSEEIWEIGREGLRALAVLLTNRTFILDTKEATVYDTDVFAFVDNFFSSPLTAESNWVREVRDEFPVLDRYISQMYSLLFPDSKKTK
jgi:Glutathione S-transferase N-terminal domain